MPKLTDTQLIVLSKAVAREDGAAVVPERMNKATATKVGASLVTRKLMREVRAKPGFPVWHNDSEGRRISLIITRAGRNAIGVEDEPPAEEPSPEKEAKAGTDATIAAAANAPRTGSKQALVIEMLSCNKGTTLEALIEATGWLPHTARAALTGLRKRGFPVERCRVEGKPPVYRIVSQKA